MALWKSGSELVNNEVRKTIAEFISDAGRKASIPSFESNFTVIERSSNWSEEASRLYCRLGTISLSKTLITEKGCAGRIGSVFNKYSIPTDRKKI
jgi:hypothetical protein